MTYNVSLSWLYPPASFIHIYSQGIYYTPVASQCLPFGQAPSASVFISA
ncbi:hypothetical protein HMPREF0972_00630 [Actinomyces sp. oral taxon 848 str. F0332]|nr:hypothetical protein HMPREF0972_00630 [Actinomyces sp. oral taxon 848 str. F0332]